MICVRLEPQKQIALIFFIPERMSQDINTKLETALRPFD